MSDDARPSFVRTALRWTAVLAVAGGLSYAGVRGTDSYRANAARRVFVADWSQFEGCLFGPSTVEDRALGETALALAKGTGDPMWPHSCSRPLTRVANAASALASESPSAAPLSQASNAMESALGEAVFWTNHVQAHRPGPPTWIAAFVRLRSEVRAWSERTHAPLPSPVAPRIRRIPRPTSEPDDPPPPEPVAGGAEADVVTSVATPTQLAWVFRDRRSLYARCVMPWRTGANASPIQCGAMTLGDRGDPRDLGLIASDGDAMLVASQRPPSDLRSVLALDSFETQLEIAGTSRADRDFIASRGAVWGVHRARFSLTLRRSGGSEIALPSDADTLWTDRAMGLSDAGPVLAWLRVARGGRGSLRWLDVSANRGGSLALEGDLSSYDRSIERCVDGANTLWLVRDGRDGGAVFAWREGALRPLARLATGVRREHSFACSEGRWALIERGAERIRVRVFEGAAEQAAIEASTQGASDVLFVGQGAWVADAGGTDRALRVRLLPEGRALFARRSYPVLPSPRGVRLLGDRSRVLVLARAEQTHAFVASAGAESLAAAELATVEPRPPQRR
ncbi:MAG: hypothetical protein U0269_00230 [Polyangiales bacterium]